MPSSQARVSTASASRYLQQVCKHWSHKFAVEFTPEKGHIPFSDGRICNLEATLAYSRCEPKRPTWRRWNGCSASSWSTSNDLPSARISARFNGRRRIEAPPDRAPSRRPRLCGHGGGVRANKLIDRWLVFATQRVRQLGLDRRNDPQTMEYERAVELDQARAGPDLGNGGLTGVDPADADERECALDAHIALRQHPRCECEERAARQPASLPCR